MQSPVLIVVIMGATLLVVASRALATRGLVALHREVASHP
jgi:hypothetical protein